MNGYKLSERADQAETNRARARRGITVQIGSAPTPEPEAANDGPRREPMRISPLAVAGAKYGGPPTFDPATIYVRPAAPRGMFPSGVTMDSCGLPSVGGTLNAVAAWGMESAMHEGLVFPGYPYLAQLTQRAEYRRIAEIRAEHMTRKWIKLRGPDEARLKAIDQKLNGPEARGGLDARTKFRKAAEKDGHFGRCQIFMDFGDASSAREVGTPLVVDERKISPTRPIKRLQILEPMWSYPGTFEGTNPLSPSFYKPSVWYVYGRAVHDTRLLTFVLREVPDMLKPSYSFGGLSLSQIAKPYVDNWLRTRQSVSDITSAFSQMVLKTNMDAALSGDTGDSVYARVDMFNATRDNRGTMVIDKDTEEFDNVAAPISGLDKLQAQALEQLASVSGIPLVVLLGVTPSGLNASSDGEIRTFYADIKADQEQMFLTPLQRIIDVVQLSIDGKIDPEVTFEFVDLWEMSQTDVVTNRKTEADTDSVYVTMGAVSNEEVRERLNEQEGGLYHGSLTGPPPEPEDDEDEPEEDDKPPADEK